MKLKIYLMINKIRLGEFSKILGCTREHLSRIINGKIRASKRLAQDIERETHGKIKAQEVLDEYKG